MTPSRDPKPLSERAGLLRIALAGVMWGTIPLVMRFTDGASLIKVFYRVFFAAIFVLGWMLVTGRLGEITSLSRRKVVQVIGQGVILTINWALFLTALDLTSIATAELLAYTAPVFVAALGPFVTGERFDRRILLPLAMALGGIAVILVPQGLGVHSRNELIGAGLAFLSALTYAALLLRSKKIIRGISGTALVGIEYVTASVLMLPIALVLYAGGHGPTSAKSYVALLVLGIVQTAFSIIVFLSGLRWVRTDRAAILTYAEPVSAVILAALFLGEPLTWTTVVGGLLVVAGGLVVTRLEPAEELEPIPLEAAGSESGNAG